MTIEESIRKLESELDVLKKTVNNRVEAFGRSYGTVGTLDSDFIIKTRGQVKVQVGGRFIDLLKNDKSSNGIIYKKKVDLSKDGIYYDEGKVSVVIDKQELEIASVDTQYVSYGEQEVDSDKKIQVQKNIGIIYDDINQLSNVKNGFAYVLSEKKLYLIKDGELIPIGDNGLELVGIEVDPDEKKGFNIKLKGKGTNTGISFYTSDIREEDNGDLSIISDKIGFKRKSGDKVIYINENAVSIFSDLHVNNIFNNNGKFKLYEKDGYSVLEVGEIIKLKNNEVGIIKSYNKDSDKQIIVFNKKTSLKKDDKFIIKSNDHHLILKILEISEDTASISIEEHDLEKDPTDDEIKELLEGRKIASMIDSPVLSVFDDRITVSNYKKISDFKDNISFVKIDKDGISTSAIQYNKDDLDKDANDNRLASTKWVNDKLKSSDFPSGAILLFNGTEVPEGWLLCDGNNGTPNLIDKVVIGANEIGDGKVSIKSGEDLKSYNLLYIIKK